MIAEKRNESSFPAVPDSRYKIHRASWAEGSVAKVCKIKARAKQHFFCKFVQAGRRVLEVEIVFAPQKHRSNKKNGEIVCFTFL